MVFSVSRFLLLFKIALTHEKGIRLMETVSTLKHPAAGRDQDDCGFPLVSWGVDKARVGHGPRFADHLSRVQRATIVRKLTGLAAAARPRHPHCHQRHRFCP